MECPDKKCRDNVVRLVQFMKIFGASIGLLLTISLGVGFYVMAADKEDKAQINRIDKQVQVYSVMQEVIVEKIETIQLDVKEIKEEHDKQMETIHQQMREDKKEIIKAIQDN